MTGYTNFLPGSGLFFPISNKIDRNQKLKKQVYSSMTSSICPPKSKPNVWLLQIRQIM